MKSWTFQLSNVVSIIPLRLLDQKVWSAENKFVQVRLSMEFLQNVRINWRKTTKYCFWLQKVVKFTFRVRIRIRRSQIVCEYIFYFLETMSHSVQNTTQWDWSFDALLRAFFVVRKGKNVYSKGAQYVIIWFSRLSPWFR